MSRSSLQGRLYRALEHADPAVRGIPEPSWPLPKLGVSVVWTQPYQVLEADEVEVRHAARRCSRPRY